MDTWHVEPASEPHAGLAAEIAHFGAAGLSLRLASLRQKLEREHPLSVALDISDRAAADSLPPDVTGAVHAIFLEAALNAVQHSGGTMVRLVLHTTGNSVTLCIEDDGAGFGFKGIASLNDLLALGVGSQTLARLVTIFGGRMRLDSRATGSRIDIVLPRDGFGRDLPIPPRRELAIASQASSSVARVPPRGAVRGGATHSSALRRNGS